MLSDSGGRPGWVDPVGRAASRGAQFRPRVVSVKPRYRAVILMERCPETRGGSLARALWGLARPSQCEPAMLSKVTPSELPVDDDAEIIARVRSGERQCFGLLMSRHNAQLYRTVRAILRCEAECEDVMQQTYVLAFSHLDQFKGTARFSTWLSRIAVREAVARLRVSPLVQLPTPKPPATPEEECSARQVSKGVDAAIDDLPDDYRAIFVLREVQGLSTAEAAACLNLSLDAAKVRLHRAKLLLRLDLAERLDVAYTFQLLRCARVTARAMAEISL